LIRKLKEEDMIAVIKAAVKLSKDYKQEGYNRYNNESIRNDSAYFGELKLTINEGLFDNIFKKYPKPEMSVFCFLIWLTVPIHVSNLQRFFEGKKYGSALLTSSSH
jgi:hypothetical protein